MKDSKDKIAEVGEEKGTGPQEGNDSGDANCAPRQDETQPKDDWRPGRWSTMIIFMALFFALVCVGLDRAIVATAVPQITVEFNSLPDVGWYGSSFLLTMCCFQLLFGKLYAHVNIKWVFLSALAIFETGSVVSGSARSSAALIVGRAVSGIGAGGLLSGGLIIISHVVPVDKRPTYTGALGGSVGISQIVAPTLGGVFTDKLTWRWCFWINLPLGGITLLVVLFLVRLPDRNSTGAGGKAPRLTAREFLSKYDLAGTLLLMPWVSCLLFALQWGGTKHAWGSWRVVVLLALFAVLLIAWVAVQVWQGDRATLPPRIMVRRALISGMSFMFLGFANFFLVVYYVPIWFQAVRDVSAYESGINFLATSAAVSSMVILSGYLTSRTGYYVPQMIAGSVINAIGCGLLYTFDRDTDDEVWVVTLVIIGLGVGLGVQQPVVAAQTVFKGADIPLATSALIFTQSLAATVFLCVGQNVFANELVRQVRQLAPGLGDDPHAVIQELGAGGIHSTVGEKYGKEALDGVVEAYGRAVGRVFLICLVLACLSVPAALGMEWVNVKKERQREVEEEEAERQRQGVVVSSSEGSSTPRKEVGSA